MAAVGLQVKTGKAEDEPSITVPWTVSITGKRHVFCAAPSTCTRTWKRRKTIRHTPSSRPPLLHTVPLRHLRSHPETSATTAGDERTQRSGRAECICLFFDPQNVKLRYSTGSLHSRSVGIHHVCCPFHSRAMGRYQYTVQSLAHWTGSTEISS
ncbi:hypothetical protein OH76DRAFT_220704 [Lentinus brumalis]|uniref:Uncharacterized protein n=1 Tax=Lentinus brumalis TaxID=2498619 RepID=A0A371CM47_9APHY|nr:hypothetical protein OH76DRAFT_220704 [Polyporus brumalis]